MAASLPGWRTLSEPSSDAVMRVVGFAEHLEDLAKPLVLTDAVPRDDDGVALASGVNVHGRLSHLVSPFGIQFSFAPA